jgi:hypothetical protein
MRDAALRVLRADAAGASTVTRATEALASAARPAASEVRTAAVRGAVTGAVS